METTKTPLYASLFLLKPNGMWIVSIKDKDSEAPQHMYIPPLRDMTVSLLFII
jgi:hypothetical protein